MVRSLKFGLLFLGVFLVSGCNGGGASSGVDSSRISSIIRGDPMLDASPDASPIQSYSALGVETDPSMFSMVELDSVENVSTSSANVKLAKIHNPEPLTLFLLGGGVLGTAVLRKRKIK